MAVKDPQVLHHYDKHDLDCGYSLDLSSMLTIESSVGVGTAPIWTCKLYQHNGLRL